MYVSWNQERKGDTLVASTRHGATGMSPFRFMESSPEGRFKNVIRTNMLIGGGGSRRDAASAALGFSSDDTAIP